MPSVADACEVCPTCRSRAFEVSRSRYIGAGELTTGYLVRVWSCGLCKREWEDAGLTHVNAARENNARRAYWDAAEGRSGSRRGRAETPKHDANAPSVSAVASFGTRTRELGRTG
jgi:hypothetical protein